MGKEHLPAKYRQKIEGDKPALSNLVVYLGLDRDLLAEGWPYHELFVTDTYDAEADYTSILNGEFEKAGMIISHYNQVDPTCTPAGGSVLVAMTLAP